MLYIVVMCFVTDWVVKTACSKIRRRIEYVGRIINSVCVLQFVTRRFKRIPRFINGREEENEKDIFEFVFKIRIIFCRTKVKTFRCNEKFEILSSEYICIVALYFLLKFKIQFFNLLKGFQWS